MANKFTIIQGKNKHSINFERVREYTRGGRWFCTPLRAFDENGYCVDACTSARSVRKFFEKYKGLEIRYIDSYGESYPAFLEEKKNAN